VPQRTTVTVVGSITKDFIWRQGERVRTSLGGLIYNTIALGALMPDAAIVPVANVGRDIFDEVTKLLSHYHNVTLEGVRRVDKQNARCYLDFVSGTHFNDGSVVPITLTDLEKFSNPDIILLTFPTGLEMTLGSLKSIRRRAKCLIYIDYHMLAHGGKQASTRFGRRRRTWADWILAADFAQFNQFEAGHLFRRPIETKSDALSFGHELVKGRTKIIVITCGEKGSFVVQSKEGELSCDHIPSVKCTTIVDTLGCGDVYSAGFIAQYLRLPDAVAAAHFASKAASQRCGAHDLTELFQVLRKSL
jgi:sugar/nucleoside kinase (ribokinase family)